MGNTTQVIKQLSAALLCIALLFNGCSAQQEETETAAAPETAEQPVTPIAQTGGALRMAMRQPQSLNPLLNCDSSVDEILKLVYEPLIAVDGSGKPAESLAESWSFSEDGSAVQVRLKPGLVWHNGLPVTADDILFSYQTIRGAAENAVYKKCIENIASIEKLDNLTVRVRFQSVYIGNLYALCFPLISSSYFSGENMARTDKNMVPMGTGSYQYESYTPAKTLTLARSGSGLKGTPYIDRIEVIFTPDESTDLYSFDQGIIDVVAADETEMGKYENTKDTNKYEYVTNYYDFIGLNFNRTILQDLKVRKAIAYAVPKESIIEGIYLNHAVSAQTPVSPVSWLYEEDTEMYDYNLNLAKILLEEAGWTDANGDGVREKTSNEYFDELRLRLLVNEENTERVQIASRLAGELNAIGFAVAVDKVPYEVYVEKLNSKDFDLFLGGWQLSVIPDYRFMFHSSRIDGGDNYISYINGEMDALLSGTINAIGEQSAKEAFGQLQKFIASNLPYISIAFRKSAVFTKVDIYGELEPMQSNFYNNIEQWFIYQSESEN